MTQGSLPIRLTSLTALKLLVGFFLGSRIVLMISFLLQTKRDYSKIVAYYRVPFARLTLSNILRGRQNVLMRFFKEVR